MRSQLTNLLPVSRIRGVRRAYFLRLAVITLILLSLLVIGHALLLIPTYLYAREQAAQDQAQITQSGGATSAEEQEVKERTQILVTTGNELAGIASQPTASAAIRSVLNVPHPGVQIIGFTFTAPQGEKAGQLGVTGVAGSRDQLRQYTTALGQLPFVAQADLPISAYAKENDIPFTITLSGPLIP